MYALGAVTVRRYRCGEEEALWTLLHDTVHAVNRAHYSQMQLDAWAPAEHDAAQWRDRLAETRPLVAEVAGQPVGFAELRGDGAIDCFYCHKDWQGKGVGSALLDAIEEDAKRGGMARLRVDASITAKPFFERWGFAVDAVQRVTRRGVGFTNYAMSKTVS